MNIDMNEWTNWWIDELINMVSKWTINPDTNEWMNRSIYKKIIDDPDRPALRVSVQDLGSESSTVAPHSLHVHHDVDISGWRLDM